MVVTRTGVSMHLTGTIAEWLGHVLNVLGEAPWTITLR